MVTLPAGETSFQVTVVRKGDWSPFSLGKGGAIQYHRIWLGPERLSKRENKEGRREQHEKSLLYHLDSVLYDPHRLITSFRQGGLPCQDTPPGIDRCSGRKRSYSEYQGQSGNNNGGREHSFSR
jgi:hypothetical protein